MIEHIEWIFGGIGVAAVPVIVGLWRKLVSERISHVSLMDRAQMSQKYGLSDRLRKANQSVWISGNDCKFVAESASPEIEAALRRGVHVRILCTDPASDATKMLAQIDPRFPTPDSFVNSMKSVVTVLDRLSSQYPTSFEYKLLPILPALGFFITDPYDKSGVVKVEIYTAKDWSPVGSRPHLLLPPKTAPWRQYFISQWENYWGIARSPQQRQAENRKQGEPNKSLVVPR